MHIPLVPIVALLIPIIAIVGGLVAGIVGVLTRHRLAVLAMKERATAIEKGLDLSLLPPLPDVTAREANGTPRERTLRTARKLRITGIVIFAGGLGLALSLTVAPEAREQHLWAVGLVPALLGLGLEMAGRVARADAPPDDGSQPAA